MKVYSVGIAFENCEHLEISGSYIFALNVKDVKEEYYIPNLGLNNDISFNKKVGDLTLGILNEAKDSPKTISHYWLNEDEEKLLEKDENYQKLGKLDRLREGDITQVEICLWDGYNVETITHHHYFVTWEGSDYFNDAERFYINKSGDILISINLNNIKDENYMFKNYPKEYLEDVKWMNCLKERRGFEIPKKDQEEK